jgi:putative oxidoreductase
MDELWLVGRILFSTAFVTQAVLHLADLDGAEADARSKGVGPARPGVIAVAVAFIVGSVSVVFGIWGDLGALLLIVTLLPVTFVMHKFWAERDPALRRAELSNFVKNVSLIGGAVLLFSWFARDTFGFGLPYTITDGAFGFR